MTPGKLIEPIIHPIIGYSNLLPIPLDAPQHNFIPGTDYCKQSPTERGPFLETEKQLNASLIKGHIKPIALSDFLFARRHTIKSGCKGNPLHDTENGDISLSPKTVVGKKSLNTFGKYENKSFLPVQPDEKTGGKKKHTISKLLSRSANKLTLKAKDNDVFVQPKSIRLSSEPFIQSLIKENKVTLSSTDQHHSYFAHNYLAQALDRPYASFNYISRASYDLAVPNRIRKGPISDQPTIEHSLELDELADKIKPVNMQDAATATGLLEEYLRHNIIATEQLEINKNFFTHGHPPTICYSNEISDKAIRSINTLPTFTGTYHSGNNVVKSMFDQSPFYRSFMQDPNTFLSYNWNDKYFSGINRNDSSMPMLLIPDCYGSDYEFKTFVDPIDPNKTVPSFLVTKAKKVIFATFGLNLIAFDCNDNLWVYGFGITHAPINIKNLNKHAIPDLFAMTPESKNHVIGHVIPKSKITGEAAEGEEHFVFQSSSWVKIPNVSRMTAENITSTIRYIHEEAETRLNTLTEHFPINYTEFTNRNIDTYFNRFTVYNFPDEKGNVTTFQFPTPGKKPYILDANAVDSLTVTKVLNYYATTGIKNKTDPSGCSENGFYKNISITSAAFSAYTDMIDLSGYFCPSTVLDLPDGKTKYVSLGLTPTQVNKNGTPSRSDTKQTELAEIHRTITGLTFLHPTAVREIHRSIKRAGFTEIKKHLRVLHTSSFMLLNSLYVYFDQAYGKERGADITGLIPTPLIEAKDGKLVPFIATYDLPRTSIIQRTAIEPTCRRSRLIQALIAREAAGSLSFISQRLSCSIPKTFAKRLDFSGRKNTIASWTSNAFNCIDLADTNDLIDVDKFPFMPAIGKAIHRIPMSHSEFKLLDKLYKASILPYYFTGFPASDKRLEAFGFTKTGFRSPYYVLYPEHMLSIALVRSFIDKSVDLSGCSTVSLSEQAKKKYTNLGVTFYRDADTEQSYVSEVKEKYLNQIVNASDYRAPKQITGVSNRKDPSYSSLCDLITKGFSLVGDAKKGTISLSKTRSLIRIKDNIERLISLDLPSNTHIQDIRKNIRMAWVSTTLIRFFMPIRKPQFSRKPDGCGFLNTSSYEHNTTMTVSYNREDPPFYIQSLNPIKLVSGTDCEYPIHGQPFRIKYDERDENGITKVNEDDITFSQDLIHESYHVKNLFPIEAKDVYTSRKMIQFNLELGFTAKDSHLQASKIKQSKSISLSNYLSVLAYFHRLSLAHIISRLSDRPDDPKNLRLTSSSCNRVPHGTSGAIFSFLSQYGFYRNMPETYRISRSALPAVFRDLRYAVIAMPASGIKEHAYAIQKHGKTYRYILSNSFISGYRKLCLQNVLTCPYTYAAIAKFSSDIQPIDAYFRLQTWIRAKQPFTNTKFGNSICIAEEKEPFARILCPSYDNGNRTGLTHLTLSDILYNALQSKTHKYSETLIKEVLL